VEYTFVSGRLEPVTVELVEPIPEALEPGDIGFVASGAADSWEIRGDDLAVTVELAPGEEVETACAARGDAAGAITDLLHEPAEIEVEPPLAAGPAAGEEAAFARSAADEAATDAAEPSAVADADDATETLESATAPDAAPAADGATVVDRFVAELRAGDVDPEAVAFLEERFDAPRRGSVEARVDQLETDLTELRAYTGALEEFLDEEGSGRAIVERLDARFDDVAARLSALERSVDDHDDDLAALDDAVADLAADTTALSADLEELEGLAAALDDDLASLDGRVPDDLDDRLDRLEAALTEVSAFTERLQTALER
jgi:uncharacterized phage infection (PIP) family protein YhgE